MYGGLFDVFIGVSAIIASFFVKRTADEATWLKNNLRTILMVGGILFFVLGTVRLAMSRLPS